MHTEPRRLTALGLFPFKEICLFRNRRKKKKIFNGGGYLLQATGLV